MVAGRRRGKGNFIASNRVFGSGVWCHAADTDEEMNGDRRRCKGRIQFSTSKAGPDPSLPRRRCGNVRASRSTARSSAVDPDHRRRAERHWPLSEYPERAPPAPPG
jgi:hypothetical protein